MHRKTMTIVFMLIGWIVIVNGIGFLVTTASPHGLAAFVYSGFFLSVLGFIAQLLYYIAHEVFGVRFLLRRSCVLGLVVGALTYPIAVFANGSRSYVPVNIYEVLVFSYLCCVGIAVALFVSFAILRFKTVNAARRNGTGSRNGTG